MKVFRFSSTDFIPASHEDPINPGVLKKVMFSREQLPLGRVQMVNWAKLGVGKEFQNHYHEKMSEVFIILNGEIEFYVNEEKVVLSRGDGILIDMMDEHRALNVGGEACEYVCFGIIHGEGGKTVVVE